MPSRTAIRGKEVRSAAHAALKDVATPSVVQVTSDRAWPSSQDCCRQTTGHHQCAQGEPIVCSEPVLECIDEILELLAGERCRSW